MGKPVKDSIAFVVYNADRSAFLIVQRPTDDENFPDFWSLPSVLLRAGESFDAAVVRLGKEKLGVDVVVGDLLGEGEIEREDYVLHMREYEAVITKGEPSVPQPYPDVIQYQAFRWGQADDLSEAAKKGSLCSRLYLESMKKD